MNLRLGSKGDEVRALQVALQALGYAVGAIDADFGPKTDAAVRALQADRGLAVDGIVGPKTWSVVLAPTAASSATVTMQSGLVLPVQRCYPLRALPDGRRPQVTSRHAIHNPSRPTHRGVDLFYPWREGDPPMKIGDGGRTAKWIIPPGTIAIAAAAGEVEIAGTSRTGWRCWIRHEGGLATGGFHLRDVRVAIGEPVELGQDLGEVGDNPVDHDAVHLHWEVYKGKLGAYPAGTCDPEIWLRGATVLPAKA